MTELTGEASRAARGLLRWSLRDLADRANVSLPTALRAENGGTVAAETIEKIVQTFEAAGVELLNSGRPGARVSDAAMFALALLPSARKKAT